MGMYRIDVEKMYRWLDSVPDSEKKTRLTSIVKKYVYVGYPYWCSAFYGKYGVMNSKVVFESPIISEPFEILCELYSEKLGQ